MQAQEDRRDTMLDLAWRDSGAKARVFAQEHGITPWTLYYWRKRLAGQERPTGRRRTRGVTLAPVHVGPSVEGGGDLEVVLASGDRIRVPADVTADTLHRVIQVLRSAC